MGDTLIIDSLSGFLREQKWDIIEEEQQKPGRKRKLNIPSGRNVLVVDLLFRMGPKQNSSFDSDDDAQKNIHQSNEFQTS